jgi:molecular chaperone IbpA
MAERPVLLNGVYDMRTLDLTPLFKYAIGFDDIGDLLDSAMNLGEGTSYPPYNIEKISDEAYRIAMAVAGFGPENLTITTRERLLIVEGTTRPEAQGITYIHRGIAGRAFQKRFQLADSIKVLGATLEEGILRIHLLREIPEAMKPRVIAIQTRDKEKVGLPQQLDHKIDTL